MTKETFGIIGLGKMGKSNCNDETWIRWAPYGEDQGLKHEREFGKVGDYPKFRTEKA